MATKCGLSYDLLRYYEKSLANILSLKKGPNNQVLFDDTAQSIIAEAVELKQSNGYSMKQLFHHFNGTSRLDGKVADKGSSGSDKDCCDSNKPNHHCYTNDKDNEINDAVFNKTAGEACDEYATDSHFSFDSSLPVQAEPQTTAISIQQIHSVIRDQVGSAIGSDTFMNALGRNIGNQVATALSSHLQHYDNNLGLMASTMKHISEQNSNISRSNSALSQENLRLQAEYETLASRMNSIEETIHEQRENTVGNRFWRWFFGVKKETAPGNEMGTEETRYSQSESFGNYFRRFLKAPVPVDKNAAKHISSVGHFSRSTTS